MNRLTVTLTISFQPDADEVACVGGWEDYLAHQRREWQKSPHEMLEGVSPVFEDYNPYDFRVESLKIEEVTE